MGEMLQDAYEKLSFKQDIMKKSEELSRFKSYSSLDQCDIANITYYIEQLYNVLPIVDADDYMSLKNRVRHILEIIEKE